ncbi:MAG: hypothetical protein U0821_27515 [Chloroflexota bacterium]
MIAALTLGGTLRWRVAWLLLAVLLFGIAPVAAQEQADQPPPDPALVRRAARVADVADHINDPRDTMTPRLREALLARRARALAEGELFAAARVNSVLSAEAWWRVSRVATRWLVRRDSGTGLLPSRLVLGRPDARHWTYGDVGADLLPHLAIATRRLAPDRFPEIIEILRAERTLGGAFPTNFSLDGPSSAVEMEEEDRMLSAAEYVKDGLMPLIEVLGPGPWVPRAHEVMRAIAAESNTPTPAGPIPAHSTEINGTVLQAATRLYWTTGDEAYLNLGDRIAAAYLDHALPVTRYLPAHRWDFMENEPIGPRRLYLGDHGNELISGLIEWHRVELSRGAPLAVRHRIAIRRMLDELLEKGRAENGLFFELIDVPSGRVRDRDYTDNWGYLGQAYLHQAQLEREFPGGDQALADGYSSAAALMLRAVSRVRFYPWEHGEMDGYADTLESAIYLLHYLEDAEASSWLDQQMGVLYGYQQDDGRVTDENIDGNFMRTAMLYGLRMSAGTTLEPWTDDVSVGAVAAGGCLALHLHAGNDWSGRLHFDTRRHNELVGLPVDYPRLNQWPEWFPVTADREYRLARPGSTETVTTGAELAAGLQVHVEAGAPLELTVCSAG